MLYLYFTAKTEEETSDEKKRQKRGGKGMVKAKKKEEVQKKIVVFVAPRGKKRLTVVQGLKTFGKLLSLNSIFYMNYCLIHCFRHRSESSFEILWNQVCLRVFCYWR